MLLKEIIGLKIPDEYIMRFFFREGLDGKKGHVLELGAGNGNNLMLFYQYGWNVTGVDISADRIGAADANFQRVKEHYGLQNDYLFIREDMNAFVKREPGKKYDVILLPNSICYIDFKSICCLFEDLKKVAAEEALVFIRVRTPQDYRYGRGKRYEDKSFILDIKETDEEGCLCTFLLESDIMKLLESNFIVERKRILYCRFDHILRNETVICNSDLIIWCRIRKGPESEISH